MLAGAGGGNDLPGLQGGRSEPGGCAGTQPGRGPPSARGGRRCGKGNVTRGGRGSGRAAPLPAAAAGTAEGADGPGTPPRLALPLPVPPAPSCPVPSWRWSGRAPAPPAAHSGLPRPRLLLARRSRRACERGRDRRNLTSKYLRSECLWISEQNWEFIWKKCCCDCSQTRFQTDFNCCIIFC